MGCPNKDCKHYNRHSDECYECGHLDFPDKPANGESFNMQVPKLKTPRSEPYKAFIREHLCIGWKSPGNRCGNPNTIAAHYTVIQGQKGWGMKVSDYWCVPLCDKCHKLLHADKYFLCDSWSDTEAGRELAAWYQDDRWVLVEIIRLRDEWEAHKSGRG